MGSQTIRHDVVKDVLSLSPNRISLSTVYFHPANSYSNSAKVVLSEMATFGNGKFVDTVAAGSSLDLATVTKVPIGACVQ